MANTDEYKELVKIVTEQGEEGLRQMIEEMSEDDGEHVEEEY